MCFLLCLCVYIFSSCLRSWLEQDTSCPTCRMSLNINEGGREREEGQRAPLADNMAAGPGADTRPHINQHNHFFHFDGKHINILYFMCSLLTFEY